MNVDFDLGEDRGGINSCFYLSSENMNGKYVMSINMYRRYIKSWCVCCSTVTDIKLSASLLSRIQNLSLPSDFSLMNFSRQKMISANYWIIIIRFYFFPHLSSITDDKDILLGIHLGQPSWLSSSLIAFAVLAETKI